MEQNQLLTSFHVSFIVDEYLYKTLKFQDDTT